MNRYKLLAASAGLTLIVLIAGCDSATNTNTTVAVSNANVSANANTNANTNKNDNRRIFNANITREEFEKDKRAFMDEITRLGRTIGSGANDAWLWTKTRAVLATTDDLRESTINVDVDNAVVTLSGSVATQAQKSKAVQVAKGIEGVKGVTDKLTVTP